MAKREPLYPHVTKAKGVLFPHKPGPKADTKAVAKEITKKSFDVRFARKYTGEMKSVIVQAPDEIDAVSIARKQLGLDITEWIPERVIIPKAEAVAKEPWQMTREEYEQVHPVNPQSANPESERRAIRREHHNSILGALIVGKPVPAEVLKDYPELAKTVAPGRKALLAERDRLETFMRERRMQISDIEYRQLERQLSDVNLEIARLPDRR